MDIADFDQVFLKLDFLKRGYLTKEEIQAYDEALNLLPLCTPQVEAAIIDICGSKADGLVRQEHFIPVLQELQRRRQLENQIQWDFMALDNSGSHLISIQDAFLLFQIVQGKHFSMHIWNEFLSSRLDPTADVCFDEVRVWLCNQPSEHPPSDGDLNLEKERLKHLEEEEVENELSKMQSYKDDGFIHSKPKEDYTKLMKSLAKRKQYIWETRGIEALLTDDGKDDGQEIQSHVSSTISITDVMDAISHKYDVMRKKLFLEMLRNHFDPEKWSEGEESDALEQMEMEEKQLRQEGLLSQCSSDLLGARTTIQPAPLDVLIGDLPGDFKTVQTLLMQKIVNLQEEGKSEKVIEKLLRKDFKSRFKGEPSDKLLIALNERQTVEHDYYLNSLSSGTSQLTGITHSYLHLLRQHLVAEHEQSFVGAVMAVGLAEICNGFNVPSIDPVRQRQEVLARERLHWLKGKLITPLYVSEAIPLQDAFLLDLQTAVVKEMTLKHQHEQAVFSVMLQGKASASSKTAAQIMNGDDLQSQIIALRNDRNNWKENITTDNTERNWTILQEAVGIYWILKFEEHQSKDLDTTALEVNASVLADLQQTQDDEFHSLLRSLPDKTENNLKALLKVQQEARLHELFDNIAAVILGTSTWTDDEKPLINAIELKYDMLRQLCLRHQLRLEYGLGWNRLAESEKDKLLIKKRVEEKKLRLDGKMYQLSEVIRSIPKDIGTLHSLLGEDRREYSKRVSLNNHKIEELIRNGEEVKEDLLDYDEAMSTGMKTVNLLADLIPRQQAEQDALIALYRSLDHPSVSEQAKLLPMILVKVEKSLAKREEWFDVGALSVGLFERITEAQHKRHKADRERQETLAKLRIQKRIARLEATEPYFKETDTTKPEKGDIQGWMLALVREVKKKHSAECEMFLNILQDPGMEELYEAASTMSAEEKTNRLLELHRKWFELDMEKPDYAEENINILEEAAAIRTSQKKIELEQCKVDHILETVYIHLLIELQDKQDLEVAELIQHIKNMTEEAMRLNREHQIKCRHHSSSKNIVTVLTKYVGSAEDNELIKTLEEKHEALVDKLLLETLIKQFGEIDCMRMSELERQKKIAELKRQARQLQKQGKEDEIMKLLNWSKEDQERLQKLLGDNKVEFLRKLEQRRQKYKEHGLKVVEEVEENEVKPVNPLTALDERFNAEKEALLANLKGTNTKLMTERERQLALIQLKREKRQAEKEGSLDEIAALIGLTERQHIELNERLKNDRLRQEEIAKRRIEGMKKQKKLSKKQSQLPGVVEGGDRLTLQNIAVLRLEEKHESERQFLIKLSNKPPSESKRKQLEAANEEERKQIRNHLLIMLDNTPQSDVKKSVSLLQEACHAKVESYRQKLLQMSPDKVIQKDDIDITLMADLQECQDCESTKFFDMMKDMENDELINLQKKIIDEMRYQRGQCIIEVLFSALHQEKQADEDVITALEEKYDALREKLLTEALEKQVGEKAIKMSSNEWNCRLAELKLQERKLREEGHLEEAAELLGLSKEEEGQKTNKLQNLENSFEMEKDRLLNALRQQKDQIEAEKERQLQIAQLRRDKRKAQGENYYEAAALAIDLGKQHGKDVEEIRLKQEKLAKERLAAELKKRKQKNGKCEQKQEEDKSIDVNDKMSLIESIFEHLDKKQLKEREFLIQLFQEPSLPEKLDADKQSVTELSLKMEELQELWKSWRQEEIAHSKEQTLMLKEALCLRMILLKRQLDSDGKPSLYDDLQVMLLADLQEIQDKETKQLLNYVENQTPFTLRHLRMSLMLAIKNQWFDSVTCLVFDSPVTKGDEDILIKALEDKYNVVRDKLFIEVLIQKMTHMVWNQLSQQEQRHHLIKLKQQYKQLLEEGKADEADQLLAGFKVRDEELQKKLRSSEQDHQTRFEQLVKKHKHQGLAVEKSVIDAILDQQDKNKNNEVHNVLQKLDHHFEEAKAELLKQLQDHDSYLSAEQKQQRELLQLRRQKRQLEQEERFDSAAILLNIAEQNEKARQDTVAKDIERQKAMAKERLEAMKKRKKEINQSKLEKELKVEKDKFEAEQTEDILNHPKKGDIVLKEAVITALEWKHYKEQQMLEQLITASKDSSSVTQSTKAAYNLGIEDTIGQLEKLYNEWQSWKYKSEQVARQMWDRERKDQDQHIKDITQNLMSELHLMTQALVLKIEVEKYKLKKADREMSSTEEEILLNLIQELYQRQEAETRVTEEFILDQSPDGLIKLKELQQMAALEGWYENLAGILFSVSKKESLLMQSARTHEELDHELHQTLETIQNKFDEEKAALKETMKQEGENGVEANVVEEIEKLAAEQDVKKQAVYESFRRRLEEERMKKEAEENVQQVKDFEKNAQLAILKMLQESKSAKEQDKSTDSTTKAMNLLQKKLAARRERHHQENDGGKPLSRGSFYDSQSKQGNSREPSFTRERTLIDLSLTDDQKNELYEQLMQQQKTLDKKLASEHKRHEQQLKKRLEEMKERRSHEAADLLRMAERQKTTLEKHNEEEHRRQLEATRKRVAQLVQEKTQTMHENIAQNTQKFGEFLSEKEPSGISQDEQTLPSMKKKEVKFK